MRQLTLIKVGDVAHNLDRHAAVRVELGDRIHLRKRRLHAVSLHCAQKNLSSVTIAFCNLGSANWSSGYAYECVQESLPLGLGNKTQGDIEGS